MFKNKSFNWGPSLFLIIYQLILLVTIPFYFFYASMSLGTILFALLLFCLTGFSITGGYHRLFSHKSYKVNPIVEGIVLFFGSMAAQGSALRWSFDHRIHHAFVDTDQDPYSIKKGFWYAHFLWILEKPRTIDPKVVPDLMKNKLVMFQHRYYELSLVITNFLAFCVVGWLFNDFWGALFLAVFLRMFALHHFTWFINSLAHTWGDKPFCKEQTAVNNFVIALVTFGEGYHNFHHTFANDYRNGIRWFHFDPTKWTIWTLNKLGLATDLKQVDPLTISKRMISERKNLLIEKIKEAWISKKDELECLVQELSERITQKIAEFKQLKEQYYEIKRSSTAQKDKLKELHAKIRFLKRSLREDWRRWTYLSKLILKPA